MAALQPVLASTPGTAPFSFLKNQAKSFLGIGATGTPTNAYVTGKTFGPGAADGIYSPASAAYDSAHDLLYVADQGSGRIMKIQASTGVFLGAIGKVVGSTGTCPSSGIATTWCTGGSFVNASTDGAYNTPYGVAYDSTHDALYITDTGNFRIVKVTASTGTFIGAIGETSSSTGSCPASSVAIAWCTGGTFTIGIGIDAGYGTPWGIAYDSAHDAIYIVDEYNENVVKVTASTGAFVGAIGHVNYSTGSCTTGTAAGWCTGGHFDIAYYMGGYWYPTYIAYDSTNDALYISNSAGGCITKVTASTGAYVGAIGGAILFSMGTCPGSGTSNGWCTGGYFQWATTDGAFSRSISGITYDATHDALYISDPGRIIKYTASTGVFVGSIGKTTASSGTCPASGLANAWCTGGTFAYSPDGDGVYNESGLIYDSTDNALFAFNPTSGRIARITATTGAFVGGDGGVSTAESSWAPSYASVAGSRDGMFNTPQGAAYDSAHDMIYIADTANFRIVKARASTGAFIGAIGNVSSSTGTCPASGAAGGWCTGGMFTYGTADGMFYRPSAIAYDSTNDVLYVADQNNSRIVKVTASTGAVVGAIGKLYSSSGTCPSSGAASGWCAGGTFTSGTGDGMFSYPAGVTYDSAHNTLFISDGYNNRIVKVTATTGAFVGAVGKTTATSGTCPSSGIASSWCTGGTFTSATVDGAYSYGLANLVYDSVNDALYISDAYNRIVKLTASTGAFVGAVGNTTASSGTCPASGAATKWCTGGTFATGSGDGMFSSPIGIALNSANNALYIADSGNNRVVKLSASVGSFAGSIGSLSSSTGSCPSSGITKSWCSGGTFVASPATGGFRAPYGIAYDSANGILFVVDSSNHRLYKTSK